MSVLSIIIAIVNKFHYAVNKVEIFIWVINGQTSDTTNLLPHNHCSVASIHSCPCDIRVMYPVTPKENTASVNENKNKNLWIGRNKIFNSLLYFNVTVHRSKQFLTQIIFIELYGFKYSYPMLIIYTQWWF